MLSRTTPSHPSSWIPVLAPFLQKIGISFVPLGAVAIGGLTALTAPLLWGPFINLFCQGDVKVQLFFWSGLALFSRHALSRFTLSQLLLTTADLSRLYYEVSSTRTSLRHTPRRSVATPLFPLRGL